VALLLKIGRKVDSLSLSISTIYIVSEILIGKCGQLFYDLNERKKGPPGISAHDLIEIVPEIIPARPMRRQRGSDIGRLKRIELVVHDQSEN
jgi:hypothetical protein